MGAREGESEGLNVGFIVVGLKDNGGAVGCDGATDRAVGAVVGAAVQTIDGFERPAIPVFQAY